jgi:hypothetical protein
MNNQFIGLGRNPNPEVPDLPTGFGMALFQDAQARQTFENLTDAQKTQVIRHVETGNVTGEDAKRKISDTVERLRNNDFNGIKC